MNIHNSLSTTSTHSSWRLKCHICVNGHTQPHKNAHTSPHSSHTQPHIHTPHTHTHIPPRTHTTHTHTPTYAHPHTNTHIHLRMCSPQGQVFTHTHTHPHTHTHTHTHTSSHVFPTRASFYTHTHHTHTTHTYILTWVPHKGKFLPHKSDGIKTIYSAECSPNPTSKSARTHKHTHIPEDMHSRTQICKHKQTHI